MLDAVGEKFDGHFDPPSWLVDISAHSSGAQSPQSSTGSHTMGSPWESSEDGAPETQTERRGKQLRGQPGDECLLPPRPANI